MAQHPLTMDRQDIRMQRFVVHCFHGLFGCFGDCVGCIVSSSLCLCQLNALAMLACLVSRIALLSSLHLRYPLPPNFSILTAFPRGELCCCSCCCCSSAVLRVFAAVLQPTASTDGLALSRRPLLPVLPCCWSGSLGLLLRAAAAACTAAQSQRSATMQVVNKR